MDAGKDERAPAFDPEARATRPRRAAAGPAALLADRRVWLGALGAVVAVSVLLRLYRIAEPIGGYFSYNEGWYVSFAAQAALKNAVQAFFRASDLNNPPLLVFLLSRLFAVTGPSVVAARLLEVTFGAAVTVYVGLLGELLYDRPVGLAAAVAVALMPGMMLVGRNVQTDTLMLAFTAAAVYHYARAVTTRRLGHAWLAGALLGAALLSKLPGVLAVAVILAWEATRWVRTRRLAWDVPARAGAAIALVAGPWFGYQLVTRSKQFVGVQADVAASHSQLPTVPFLLRGYLNEFVWMVAPVVVVLLVLGLYRMARARTSGDMLVFCALAVYGLYYLFFRFHSYYLLPTALFVALAAGRGLVAFLPARRGAYAAALGALVLSLALFSFVTLAGVKYGAWSAASIEPALHGDPSAYAIAYTPAVGGNEQLTLTFYVKRARLTQTGDPAGTKGRRVLVLDYAGGGRKPTVSFTRHVVRLVLFGYALGQQPWNIEIFGNGRWGLTRVGPLWRFGVDDTAVVAEEALYPPGPYGLPAR